MSSHVWNLQDIWNKTWYPKAADHIQTQKPWYIVDATDKILGRLASTIAIHIRGKNLATYTPSVDMGAFVIVVSSLHSYAPIMSSYLWWTENGGCVTTHDYPSEYIKWLMCDFHPCLQLYFIIRPQLENIVKGSNSHRHVSFVFSSIGAVFSLFVG